VQRQCDQAQQQQADRRETALVVVFAAFIRNAMAKRIAAITPSMMRPFGTGM
jgi:hypothetical protein